MNNGKYIQYNVGEKKYCSHIDAVHAQSPRSDQYTGEIVMGVIDKINASGIVATISRNTMDLNRARNITNAPAIDEFRSAIFTILHSKGILDPDKKLLKNYLHLAIHGMRNSRTTEFEIGTRNGDSCSPEIKNWLLNRMRTLSEKIGDNSIFPGDPSKSVHRHGDFTSNYSGYGERFNTIQIEINRDWRMNRQESLVSFFSEVIQEFDKEFN